ncbi:NYN domain-containing protein [Anoxynatronum buryatiense]|uniref:NYN domain-containing protein n=1 Tax=Anoxynatronum buryatiense TaxID=489973 RepID=A0AA45WZ69_9CLOT|nr:NYN domain-containing protein [Anoxynatronum buryatiense]SMP69908.1 hypothetical protein SAMN06296020_11963 [Anoxynatronum buryatiense]
MKEILILDGYNVMNALPELQAMVKHDFQGARDRLIDLMAEYRTFRGIDVRIVFDAHLAPRAREHREIIQGVEVIFTKEKMTADSYIEKSIEELAKKRQVIVVTNDWTEQLMVLGSGAVRVSVRELQLDLTAARGRIRETACQLRHEKDFLSNRIDEKTLQKLEVLRNKSEKKPSSNRRNRSDDRRR